jgi:hypothetical protein
MTRRTFTAKGFEVWADPINTKVDGGTKIDIGFAAITINPIVDNRQAMARVVADALNSYGKGQVK